MNFVVQHHNHHQEDPYSNFIDSLRSEQTKYKYAYHLKRYMEFLNVKDFTSLLILSQDNNNNNNNDSSFDVPPSSNIIFECNDYRHDTSLLLLKRKKDDKFEIHLHNDFTNDAIAMVLTIQDFVKMFESLEEYFVREQIEI